MSGTGRILIVDGATGIGREAVRRFRAAGEAVAVADRNAEDGQAGADEPLAGRGVFIKADLPDEAAPAAIVDGAYSAV